MLFHAFILCLYIKDIVRQGGYFDHLILYFCFFLRILSKAGLKQFRIVHDKDRLIFLFQKATTPVIVGKKTSPIYFQLL